MTNDFQDPMMPVNTEDKILAKTPDSWRKKAFNIAAGTLTGLFTWLVTKSPFWTSTAASMATVASDYFSLYDRIFTKAESSNSSGPDANGAVA